LSAATVRVRQVEVVVLLDDPTGLTPDLRSVSLNCADHPIHLEVLST